MGYGSRKYGHINKEVSVPLPPEVPTFICNHCKKIKHLTSKIITLTGVKNNALFLSSRLCDDCGKLLQDWLK